AAAVQRDHGGKRPLAIRLVELGVQLEPGRGNLDLMWRWQRGRIGAVRHCGAGRKQHQEKPCLAHWVSAGSMDAASTANSNAITQKRRKNITIRWVSAADSPSYL